MVLRRMPKAKSGVISDYYELFMFIDWFIEKIERNEKNEQ